MPVKVALVRAAAALTAIALRLPGEPRDAAVLEAQVAGQLDALRAHLFER
ncbi:MAG: hypothetical protein ACREQB_10375 [Candidatus Binataceae bacterium]